MSRNAKPSPSLPQGPVKLPPARDARDKRLAMEHLNAAKLSPGWLPDDSAGLGPIVADLRGQHLAVLHRLADASGAVTGLTKRFAAEDNVYRLALAAAARSGEPADDNRTPEADRESQMADALDTAWACAHVLGEVIDRVVFDLHEHEGELLAQLRNVCEAADERNREAVATAHAAHLEALRAERVGSWLLQTVDGGPMAGTAPDLSQINPKAQRMPGTLERPWHREAPTPTTPQAA